jgi:hypothetical protein
MKKLKLTKVIAITLVAASVLALNPIGANAEWKQDAKGWWYTEGNSWAEGFRVIDGYLYFFDSQGYMDHGKPNDFGDKVGLNDDGQFTNVTINGAWAFCKLSGEIVAYLGSDSNVVIPDKIDNVAVTGIGNKAFYKHNNIKNIIIPNSVTNIEDSAFYGCANLASLNIPASVQSIGEKALIGCSSLANISVDDNNISYKSVDGVLYSKNGTNILCYPAAKVDKNYTIPSGVIIIGNSVFSKCTNLTSIEIPDSVKTIDYRAFEGCTGLTEIKIPDSVTSIVNSAFIGCSNLTSANIPSGLTSIEPSIFAGCTNLTSMTIPNSVTQIGMSAFGGCKNTNFYVKSEAMKQLLRRSGVNQNKIVVSV